MTDSQTDHAAHGGGDDHEDGTPGDVGTSFEPETAAEPVTVPAAEAGADADAEAGAAAGTAPFDDPDGGFAGLGLHGGLLAALADLGYEEPTPIQAEAVPPLIAGRDLLGQAATGTGKTAAFALPILQRLVEAGRRDTTAPLALVLVPTRELAMQVSEAAHKYGRRIGARVVPVYGGQPIGRQLQALGRGVDVVVATPGRAVDHVNRGSLRLEDVAMVVLDEADEMLDMGFAEDLEAILGAANPARQTVLFSATLPSRISRLAERHLTKPVRVQIAREVVAEGEAPRVRQVAYVVRRADKPAALGRILDVESPGAAIVFCRTRGEVDDLTETLNGRGYRAEGLHGGMSQEQRDRVMGRVRSGSADLLIATDVAARGLDVEHLTHVVNYDVPSAPEAYVHRIGRVGRAGREGVAVTLAEPREHRLLQNIERVTRQSLPVEKVPTVADLRSRRLELLVESVRESASGDLDPYRAVLEALDDLDPVVVALAAIRLAADASAGGEDTAEIAQVELWGQGGKGKDRPKGRDDKPWKDKGDKGDKPWKDKGDKPWKDRDGDKPWKDKGGKGKAGKGRPGDGPMASLWIGLGKEAGVRPKDLVGAITGEAGLKGSEIGAITLFDRFSLVEVPVGKADDVLDRMHGALIRGRKAKVRRDRGHSQD